MFRFLVLALIVALSNALLIGSPAIGSPRAAIDMAAKKKGPKQVAVLLNAVVEGLGASGALVNVKPAFAENMLVRKGLGSIASREMIDRANAEAAAAAASAAVAKKYAEEAKQTLQTKFGAGLVIEAQVDKEGALKEVITAEMLANQLTRAGVKIEADAIQMADQTELGSVVAELTLHPEVSASVKVVVEKSKIVLV